MSATENEVYLGDGLYASFDGWMFLLRAPRDGGDHYVGLEDSVMREFIAYARRTLEPYKAERRFGIDN